MARRRALGLLLVVCLCGCSTPTGAPAAADAVSNRAVIHDGKLACDDRALEPARNPGIFHFIADYVRGGGFVDRELRTLNWQADDMYMSVIPDFRPSYSDTPSTFVMVLGQCGQAPLRQMPIFEVFENPVGSGRWETEGGYPLSVYTMKVD